MKCLPIFHCISLFSTLLSLPFKAMEINQADHTDAFQPQIHLQDPLGPTAEAAELANAVWLGDLEQVKILISKNPHLINAQVNDANETALFLATMQRYTSIAKFLIRNGAEVNAQDPYGDTPLHWAATSNSPKIIKELVRAGAIINTKNRENCTPLHEAADCGSDNAIKTLIELEADLDRQDQNLRTPLHKAVYQGNYNAIKLLIAAGANLNLKDDHGFTCLDLAADDKNMKQLLEYYFVKTTQAHMKTKNLATTLGLALYCERLGKNSPVSIIDKSVFDQIIQVLLDSEDHDARQPQPE